MGKGQRPRRDRLRQASAIAFVLVASRTTPLNTARLAVARGFIRLGARGPLLPRNALTQSVAGLFKTEVIDRRTPWRSFQAVEYAPLDRVNWFYTRRLLEPVGNTSPAEAEDAYYVAPEDKPIAV